MSKLYTYDPRSRSYRVPVPATLSVLGYVQRRTRNAAGMTATAARSGHKLSDDAQAIAVKGHAARALGLSYYIKRGTQEKLCPCCHQSVSKSVLNQMGQHRLNRLRQLRADRAAWRATNCKPEKHT